MLPRAGRLRHKIVIQYKAPLSPSKNAIGEDDFVWATFHTCQGQINNTMGKKVREDVASKQTQSELYVQITIRYFAGILADMRVLHDTTYYDIGAVDVVDERNRMTVLYCTRGVSLG